MSKVQQGWMFRATNTKATKWQRRFYVLDADALWVFSKEGSRQARNKFALSGASVIRRVYEKAPKAVDANAGFELTLDETESHSVQQLHCATEKECAEWLTALHGAGVHGADSMDNDSGNTTVDTQSSDSYPSTSTTNIQTSADDMTAADLSIFYAAVGEPEKAELDNCESVLDEYAATDVAQALTQMYGRSPLAITAARLEQEQNSMRAHPTLAEMSSSPPSASTSAAPSIVSGDSVARLDVLANPPRDPSVAATRIQCRARGLRVRRRLGQWHAAAIRLQCATRGTQLRHGLRDIVVCRAIGLEVSVPDTANLLAGRVSHSSVAVCPRVYRLHPGGAALRSARISVDDLLLAVNGHRLYAESKTKEGTVGQMQRQTKNVTNTGDDASLGKSNPLALAHAHMRLALHAPFYTLALTLRCARCYDIVLHRSSASARLLLTRRQAPDPDVGAVVARVLSPLPQPKNADACVGESAACREALFRVRAGDVVLAINGRMCGDIGHHDDDDCYQGDDERSLCLNYVRTLEAMRTASFPLHLRLRIPDGAPPRIYSVVFRASPGMQSGHQHGHSRKNRSSCEPVYTQDMLSMPPPQSLMQNCTVTTTRCNEE